jgi:hypothetical protein
MLKIQLKRAVFLYIDNVTSHDLLSREDNNNYNDNKKNGIHLSHPPIIGHPESNTHIFSGLLFRGVCVCTV